MTSRRTRPASAMRRRRGRRRAGPPARNEILRGRPARRARPGGARGASTGRRSTSTTSTWSSARSTPCGRPAAERRHRLRGEGEPGACGRRPPRPARARRGRRLGRGARDGAAGRAIRADRIVVTGPGKRDARAARRRSRPASGRSPSSRPASWTAWSGSRLRRAGASRSSCALGRHGRRAWSGSGWSATTGPASSAWTSRDLRAAARIGGRLAAPRPARHPPLRRVERARRGPPGRPRGRDGASWRGRVAAHARVPLRLVDAGAASGIPYEPHEEPLDLADLGRRLARVAEGWATTPGMRDLRLLLEPGRFLVGPAGAYVARVVDRKRVGEARSPSSTAASTTCCARRSSGRSTGCGSSAPDPRAARSWPVTIAGPLCSGLDVFAANATLPAPAVGDLVAVLDAGAYGFTESMPLFLSHADPGRGRDPRRAGGAHPAAPGAGGVARPAAAAGVVTWRREGRPVETPPLARPPRASPARPRRPSGGLPV